MPTFLVTRKMAPELARRIEASVSGRPVTTGHTAGRGTRRAVSVARFGLALVAVLGVGSFVSARRHANDELERTRDGLLADVRRHSSKLTAEDKTFVTRVSPWLVGASGAYEGDFVAPELRGAAFAARLAEPAVYVRGPIAAFSSPAGQQNAAAASPKDAFLLCLAEPPSSRTEKVLLGKVRVAYTGGAEARTPNTRRLHEAQVGLPLLLAPWEERVATATEPRELRELRRELDKAPLEAAKSAAKAKLLLFAMDEPGRGTGPTEVDGERPHEVRVGLVDLARSRVLLRLRRPVDPAWISETARVQFATGLDGCLLALDVHAALQP